MTTSRSALGHSDTQTTCPPVGAVDALELVRDQLQRLDLPVVDVQGRFSRTNGALMVFVTIAKACNQRYLSVVEFSVIRTINSRRAKAWKTQVYWRYQLPVDGSPQPALQGLKE